MAKLFFNYSAMNAGKSTTLLQAAHNYKERGHECLLFTPSIDNRYKVGEITSRIGLSSKAIIADSKFDLYEYTNQIQNNPTSYACVMIDEAHFFTKDHVHQMVRIVDHLNIPVMAFGLRTDFMGEPFPGSLYLLALSDKINEIKTICFCGKKATMNVRLDQNKKKLNQGEQVLVGGNETYVSTCRKHFFDYPS